MSFKKILGFLIGMGFLAVAGAATFVIIASSNLPQLITVDDYEPLMTSDVFDRDGNKIGEFFRERRILIPYKDIPKIVTNAFIAAEDDSFFEHGGINYVAIVRAMIANIKAGQKVQGASTITQQVARSLLLTSEKTYTRKVKEVMLAYKMENNLTKEEILYLYLNQIYFGQGAYGIGAAAKIYYRKDIRDINLAEASMLAGLPKAPSRFAPTRNPQRAKARQRYVLTRMAEENFVSAEEAEAAAEQPLQVFLREDYQKNAPFYLEIVRQMLVKHLGEEMVLDKGIKVYTGLDMQKQVEAQNQLRSGLRQVDKRQGYRGPKENIDDANKMAEFLLQSRNELLDNFTPVRIVRPDGTIEERGPLNLTGFAPTKEGEKETTKLPTIPEYIKIDDIVDGVVTKVDDKWGMVYVRFAESKGFIDIESMEWAREPDPKVNFKYARKIEKPSQVLKQGDVIQVKVAGKRFRSKRIYDMLVDIRKDLKKKKQDYERPEDLPEFDDYAHLELEQEPLVEAALVSFDQYSQDVVAMVGGYDFAKSQFNRALQAARQTGSSFKSLVYTSALDKGYTPATPIVDSPIVFEEEGQTETPETPEQLSAKVDDAEGETEATITKWKPMNHSKRFMGDLLFKNALIRSLNVPTVKIIENIGVDWVMSYARRLGIFSSLNKDYTLALGSSSVTLYEMTKAFSQLGRNGKRIRPLMIKKVEDRDGKVLLQSLLLDDRFEDEISALDENFEARRLAFLEYENNPEKYLQDRGLLEEPGKKPNVVVDPSATNEEAPQKDENGQEIEQKKDLLADDFDVRKEPPLYFKDRDQLIKPSTAYMATTMLIGAVEERHGTGRRAKSLGRPVAGKTGTTNGYYDGWFVGYTPQIATGVWVGFDNERSLGAGEVGGRAALPIWLEYMKTAHEGLPVRNFSVPDEIVFANIDNETGKLASASSKDVVKQAFLEGTEPTVISGEDSQEEEENFYKEDLSE